MRTQSYQISEKIYQKERGRNNVSTLELLGVLRIKQLKLSGTINQ